MRYIKEILGTIFIKSHKPHNFFSFVVAAHKLGHLNDFDLCTTSFTTQQKFYCKIVPDVHNYRRLPTSLVCKTELTACIL